MKAFWETKNLKSRRRKPFQWITSKKAGCSSQNHKGRKHEKIWSMIKSRKVPYVYPFSILLCGHLPENPWPMAHSWDGCRDFPSRCLVIEDGLQTKAKIQLHETTAVEAILDTQLCKLLDCGIWKKKCPMNLLCWEIKNMWYFLVPRWLRLWFILSSAIPQHTKPGFPLFCSF